LKFLHGLVDNRDEGYVCKIKIAPVVSKYKYDKSQLKWAASSNALWKPICDQLLLQGCLGGPRGGG